MKDFSFPVFEWKYIVSKLVSILTKVEEILNTVEAITILELWYQIKTISNIKISNKILLS